jgi:uncharacterized protein (DUF2126 family)
MKILVTKPYSDKQWEDIMQVGNDVEKDLIEGDVRLTGRRTLLFLLMTLKVLNGILLLTVL